MKKLIGLLFAAAIVMVFSAESEAQGVLKNLLSATYELSSDTLTNTATTTMTSERIAGNHNTVTVQVVVDELSGTTAGTVTLLGSLDGVNFKPLTDTTTVPTIGTWTLIDQAAPQTYIWRIIGSPCLYYQVSHSGGTSMSAIITGKVLAH